MTTEVWIPIPNYERFYSASDQGRIMRTIDRYGKVVNRILKPTPRRNTYVCVTLWSNGVNKLFDVHTLIMLTFVGERPDGYNINHKNGIKSDNRLDNLEYTTFEQNSKHAIDVLGKRMGKVKKLSDDQVREIRRLLRETDLPQWYIAKMFGVAQGMVSRINLGKAWRHVV